MFDLHQSQEVSRRLDEGGQPDAGLAVVGGEALLEMDPGALHLQVHDQVLLPVLSRQLRDVSSI